VNLLTYDCRFHDYPRLNPGSESCLAFARFYLFSEVAYRVGTTATSATAYNLKKMYRYIKTNDKRDKCVCITLYSITSNNVSGSSLGVVLINARMILLLKLILKLYSNAATSTYLISQRDLPYRCKFYRMAF